MVQNNGGGRPWRYISGTPMIQCMEYALTTYDLIYRGRRWRLWFWLSRTPVTPTGWCPRPQSLTPNVESALWLLYMIYYSLRYLLGQSWHRLEGTTCLGHSRRLLFCLSRTSQSGGMWFRVVFFCRGSMTHKLFSPFSTKFLQVSGRSNLKIPLVPMVLYIKGAQAHFILGVGYWGISVPFSSFPSF